MHGLPPELMKIVRPCPRGSRINPLSYEPGGSDVVVAYSLGDAILYDWIKCMLIGTLAHSSETTPVFIDTLSQYMGVFVKIRASAGWVCLA